MSDLALWSHHGRAFAGRGRIASINVGTGRARGAQAWEQLREELGRTGRSIAFGSLTFDPHATGSVLFVPEILEERTAPVVVSGDAARPRFAGSSMDEVRWLEEVTQVVKAIDAGEVEKVVLARDERLWSETAFDEEIVAARLARAFPGCYTFVCDGLVGATPELLLAKRGRCVQSLVLAGSARRGRDEAHDRAVGDELMASVKERGEHDHAVRSVRDALEDVCAVIDVEVSPHLVRLPNVQHLATGVVGELADDTSCLSLLDMLHPTAAVGGVSREAALERIRTAEGNLRGRYAGPVGWVNADGDGEWGIALRCARLEGKQAVLFAGAGIVAGSLPEEELEETRLKFRAVEAALGL